MNRNREHFKVWKVRKVVEDSTPKSSSSNSSSLMPFLINVICQFGKALKTKLLNVSFSLTFIASEHITKYPSSYLIQTTRSLLKSSESSSKNFAVFFLSKNVCAWKPYATFIANKEGIEKPA